MEAGKFYHIYNRGNNKEIIYRESKNYQFFLDKFSQYLHDWVDVYSYCLMPNHFHFLIRVKPETESDTKGNLTPLEKAFRDFFVSYAKAFNKAYDRTGSLFNIILNAKKWMMKTIWFGLFSISMQTLLPGT